MRNDARDSARDVVRAQSLLSSYMGRQVVTGPLYVLNDIGSGAGVLFNSLVGARPPRGFGRDPGSVDGMDNGSCLRARRPTSIR